MTVWRKIQNYLNFAWKYRSVMANDTDWDYAPLVRLMAEKLHHMADAFESEDAMLARSERKAGEMRHCALYLESVADGNDDDAITESDLTEALAIMQGGLLDWWD